MVATWIATKILVVRQPWGHSFTFHAFAWASHWRQNSSPIIWRALNWQGGHRRQPNKPTSLTEDLQLHNIIIASDAKQVVRDVTMVADGRYGPIIREIISRSALLNCKITFEGMAANTDADRVANFSYSLD